MQQTKLSVVRAAMASGQWETAILLAAKFPQLGGEAAAIHRGREGILRPEFQRSIKRDPLKLIEEAKQALIRRYGNV